MYFIVQTLHFDNNIKIRSYIIASDILFIATLKTRSIARAKLSKKSEIVLFKVRIANFSPEFLSFIVQALYFDNSIKLCS